MTTTVETVQKIYVAFFNRPADKLGEAFWVDQLTNQGMSVAQMAAGFAGSAEYKALYAGMDNLNVVATLYQNLFARPATLTEALFWANLIQNKTFTVDNIALQLANSAQGTDNDAMNNKVQASVGFTAGLDTLAKAQGYSGMAANVQARTWLATVGSDAASLAAAVSGTGAAITAAVNAYAQTTGQTYTLTTGIDTNVVGGAGNDTFNAVGTTLLNAFNALDSIDGGAGSDTLNIVSSLDTNLGAGAASVKNVETVNLTDAGKVTLNTTGWTGLTALNVAASTGAGALTADGTTAVTQVNTLASAAAAPGSTTIDGGSTVTLTATGATSGANVLAGDIVVGGTTAAKGAVTVNATETVGVASSSAGNVSVLGGTDVTVTETVNSAVAVAAAAAYGGTGAAAAVTAGNANEIVVNGATGIVNVTSNTNTTAAAAGVTVNGAEVDVKGGTTVTVTETAATAAADTNLETIKLGAVNVTGGAATTSVTVTQAAANNIAASGGTSTAATAAVAAVTGVNGVTAVAAAPGVQAVAAVGAVNGGTTVAAAAAKANAAIVVDGAVTIADKTNATTATSTINTVTLTNYADSSFAGAALTTLNLSGTTGKLTINNGAAAGATNTALTLNLNGVVATNNGTLGAGADNTITDTNNEIKTLNVVTGATASTITGIKDTGLTTLNLSGASTLTLGTAPSTAGYSPSLATIAVSGAAGFSADVSGLGATLKSFTTTSSGKITATLDAANQTFVGSTGQDVITIAVNPTKTITGGSGSADQLILSGATSTYNATGMAKVTGFESLGVNDATAADVNTLDMKNVFSGYSTVELISANTGKQTVTNAADGTKLLIDAAQTSVEFDLFNASTTGVANVTLNKTTATTGITVGTLTLNDSNADGIATLNLVSNTKTAAPAGGTGIANTITTLADTSLSTLNISGSAALAVGTLNLGQPGQAVPVGVASLTINDTTTAFSNTGSAKVAGSIVTLTDDTLGTLNFTGSNNFAITTLNDNNAVNLNIGNTGTGNVSITTLGTGENAAKAITNGLSNLTFTGSGNVDIGTIKYVANSAALTYTNSGTGVAKIGAITEELTQGGGFTGTLATTTKMTLNGNIQLGVAGATVAGDTPVILASTGGVTFAAGTDNAHISLQLTGAAVGNIDTITVGNANNYIKDASSAGTVNVTVGSGANYIDVSGGTAATYVANVTLGAHTNTATAFDQILVSKTSTQGTGYSTNITGVAAGDVIAFAADAAQSAVVTLTAAQQSTLTASGSLATAITTAFGMTGTAHNTLAFVYGGDTYVIENVGADTAFTAGTDSVVHLVGVHTIAQVTAAGAASFAIVS